MPGGRPYVDHVGSGCIARGAGALCRVGAAAVLSAVVPVVLCPRRLWRLTGCTRAQLKAVLRFFRSKRDTSLAEVDAIVSDAIAEKYAVRPRTRALWMPLSAHCRLNETMYNQEDVEGILRGLAEELKVCVCATLLMVLVSVPAAD